MGRETGGRLQGKVAVITGTARGQGRVAALRFAAEGARVIGTDLEPVGAQETVEEVEAAGGEMRSLHPVDLGDEVQATEFIAFAADAWSGFDILYNNASVQRFSAFESMTADDWRFTMRNELDPVFYCCKAAWPHLMARTHGAILNTASVSGMIALPTGQAAHASANGAIIALTWVLAMEGGRHGIRANSISPSVIETPVTEATRADPKRREILLSMHMLRRFGQSDDVVNCAIYLCSDEATWVTGSNFVIDGGMTVAKPGYVPT